MSAQISNDDLLRFARKVRVEILEDLGDHEKIAALEPLDLPESTVHEEPNVVVQRRAARGTGFLGRRRGRSA